MKRWLTFSLAGAVSFIVTWIIVASIQDDPSLKPDAATSTAQPYAAQAEATDARMAAASEKAPIDARIAAEMFAAG